MGKLSDKPLCKYGPKCYRKNPKHLEEYSHGSSDDDEEHDHDAPEPPAKKVKVDDFSDEDSLKDSDDGHSTESVPGKSKQTETKSEKEESTEAAVGASSGYVREEDSDDDAEETVTAAPPSPDDIQANIKSKFLVEMPEDFYDFWEFAKSINSKNPLDALKSSLGLQLVGPYDIVAGAYKNKKPKRSFLTHWRYYYDPPEFQTIVRGDESTLFHMGYFRDDPNESPVFVASNAAKTNGTITPRGENIFAAVHWFIEDKMKKEKQKGGALAKLKDKVTDAAKKGNYSLELKTKNMKARDKKVVCKSFHGAGIVVPVDENEVGYREVPESPADLKKMFKKIVEATSDDERDKAMDPLMEIIMLVQFANDECDYGEGLELGMDMFSYGGEALHKMILNLMPLAYQLLRRPEFGQIVQSHLSNRKAPLSVF